MAANVEKCSSSIAILLCSRFRIKRLRIRAANVVVVNGYVAKIESEGFVNSTE